MKVHLQPANGDDIASLVALRVAVNDYLTARFGKGYWASGLSEKGARFAMKMGTVYVARDEDQVIATLTLSTRKPWAIDATRFSISKRPLYLTSMEVSPSRQRRGVGRQCLEEARRITREWPADAIRLDAYDTAAGAGDFYRKCGFREVGRANYRNAPLIYFEMLV
jgi:ribosomal protein S18 acetylase RimI-like enzyme